METIKLQNKEEVNQFYTFLNENPDVVIANEGRRYILNTDQIIELPENKYENKLVFGKDLTEEIVNISFKNNKIYKYFKDGREVTEDYFPYFLSSQKGKVSQELKGSQYYKYINHYPIDKFEEIQEANKWSKELWFPRSIEEGYMMLHGSTYFKGLKLSDISVLSFDIENLDENRYNHKDLVVIISNTFRDNTGIITKKLFSVKDYKNSVEMVNDWCNWVRKMNPDVITGHNIFIHDLRILNLVTPLKLGRDNSFIEFSKKISKIRKDGQQSYDFHEIKILGREVIDTFFLSIKYDALRKFPSYGLKAIEKYLNLVDNNRIEWDFTKNPVFKTLNDETLWKEFIKYSIDDADSPLKIIDKMLPSYFYFTESIPLSLQMVINTNTGGQINSFLVRSYLQENKTIPNSTKITEHVQGGISFAVPAIYRNLFKIDLKSAYPSQILRFKLYDKKKDPEGNFYKTVKYFTEQRFEFKRIYKETGDKSVMDRDASSKIFINSAYGVTITNYLNFNSPEIGAKITEETRNIIDISLKWASGKDKDYWMKLFKEKTGQECEIDNE